eukprot:402036_1
MIIQQLDHKYFAKPSPVLLVFDCDRNILCNSYSYSINLSQCILYPNTNPNNDYSAAGPQIFCQTYVPTPTSDPTLQPTKAPTPFNVYCNDGIKYKQTYDAEWQYRLYITETAIVRFHTCDTLKLFDMFIKDEQDPNTNYTWTKCGSICVESSQCSEILTNGTYLLHI